MTDSPSIAQLERSSVQVLPDPIHQPAASDFWSFTSERAYSLPLWGTRTREYALRRWFLHEYNWLGQSAFAGLIKKVKSAPWQIKGKRGVDYFQTMLRESDFGVGWDDLISKLVLDFLCQDGGGWVEVIAPGDPRRSPVARVQGLAPLDSLRVMPTGSPEYPALYTDVEGKQHLMHRDRVKHFVDLPTSDERKRGYGLSAMSRAISIVRRSIEMDRYVEAKLDDKPPPGIVSASNMTEGTRNAAFATYRSEQSTDEQPLWGKTLWLYAVNPQFKAELDYITFQQAPESWDFEKYTQLNVNAFALALGVDVQELWQLTGGNIGSAGQSQILHAKSQGRMFGDILTKLERVINDILPDNLEFQFKRHDPYEEDERATTAAKWAGVNTSVAATLSVDEQRRFLAATIEAYKDIVSDPNGMVRSLSDVDPEAVEETQDDTGTAPAQANQQAQDDSSPAQDSTPNATQKKDFGETRAQFVTDVSDLMRAGRDDDLTRRRAGTVMRAQLSRLGRAAYEDGLKAGGVEDGMGENDRATFAVWLAEQSGYVTGFMDELYSAGLTDAQVEQRAEMWANKSLTEAYQRGLQSADGNGLYEWVLGLTELHCASCAGLNGQKHRLDEYIDKKLTPGNFYLACHGFNCKCMLQKTTGRASGNWLN